MKDIHETTKMLLLAYLFICLACVIAAGVILSAKGML